MGQNESHWPMGFCMTIKESKYMLGFRCLTDPLHQPQKVSSGAAAPPPPMSIARENFPSPPPLRSTTQIQAPFVHPQQDL
uniref:Uncharacterized protein n=1 Tax=Aegilops tauschii subsp. strangulata TaxID=200361 RepID=A0A453E8E6_AEGTS